MRRRWRFLKAAAWIACAASAMLAPAGWAQEDEEEPFTRTFMFERCTWSNRGSNPYFILEPGYRLILQGRDDGEEVAVVITVTNQTRWVGNVLTRVVVERETVDGEVIEISRNFFAICKETNSVAYFGEEVDIFENGQIVSHEGAWLAGRNNARPGIIMPGTLLLGARYFQEIAPGVAMDRAEIERLDARITTPAGAFQNCLVTEETTPLEPGAESIKVYAPRVGLVKDGPVSLVQALFVN